MRTLKTTEAAALLNVSANTLRGWEQRFDFPRPLRTRGGHRLYAYAETSRPRRDAI
jgi:MerR family transcriptional regulator, light-induced transcriptional regulator